MKQDKTDIMTSREPALSASGQGSLSMGGPGLIAVTTEGADVERLEGDGVYTVPAGVEEIAVTLIGGGGAAGAHAGGEPGDFQPMKLFVRPGSQFRYSVGSGGLPGVNNGKGGDSVFEAV